eukprot:SAG31_NODE_123_length_23712_cov_41.426291_30_plen_88_part_00
MVSRFRCRVQGMPLTYRQFDRNRRRSCDTDADRQLQDTRDAGVVAVMVPSAIALVVFEPLQTAALASQKRWERRQSPSCAHEDIHML